MTDTVAPTATRDATTRSSVNVPALFGAGILLGGVVIFAGNTDLKKGDNGGLGPAIFSAVLVLVVAALLWFVVLPRIKNVDRSVIIVSVLAVLSVPAFWLGITPLLAAAAIAIAGRASRLGNPARVLEVLAGIAAVATVVISVGQSRVF
jgi:hypothetical protein